MRKILLLIGLSLFSIILNAQYFYEWEWVRTAGSTYGDGAMFIDRSFNGGNAIGGLCYNGCNFGVYTASGQSTSYKGYFISTINSNGTFTSLTHSDFTDECQILASAEDSVGNRVYIGTFMDELYMGSHHVVSVGAHNTFIAKRSANGSWLWLTSIQSSDTVVPHSVDIDSAGRVYVSGEYRDDALFGQYSVSISGEDDGFVACLDSAGNFQWVKTCSGTNYDEANKIMVHNNRIYHVGFFIEAAQVFGQPLTASPGPCNSYIACFDTLGNVVSLDQIPGNNIVKDFAFTDDNDLYILGEFYQSFTLDNHTVTSNGLWDIFVAKLDSTGTCRWLKSEGSSGTEHVYEMECYNNRIFITGHLEGRTYFDNYMVFCSSQRESFVAEIDSLSSWKWVRSLQSTNDTFIRSIYVAGDNEIYVAGSFLGDLEVGNQVIANNGSYDILIAKLSDPYHSTDDNTITYEPISITNYPNPFNPETTIEYSLNKQSNVELTVYNIKGQKVKTLVSGTKDQGLQKVIWKGDDSSGHKVGSGVYFYVLKTPDSTISKKMLLLK